MMIHTLCHTIAGNPSLIGNTLLDPVCFFIRGKVHAEYKKFAPQKDLILSQTDIQLTASYIREQYLTDALLGAGQYNFFLDPVCIFPDTASFSRFIFSILR